MYTDAPNNWSDKTENISGTVGVDTSFVTGAGEILVLGAEAECLPILAPVRPTRTSRRYIDFNVTVPVLMGFDLGRADTRNRRSVSFSAVTNTHHRV